MRYAPQHIAHAECRRRRNFPVSRQRSRLHASDRLPPTLPRFRVGNPQPQRLALDHRPALNFHIAPPVRRIGSNPRRFQRFAVFLGRLTHAAQFAPHTYRRSADLLELPDAPR
jgi:hypothetical protein